MEFQNLFWGLNKSSRSCNRKPPFVSTKNLKIKKRSENIFLLILDGPAQKWTVVRIVMSNFASSQWSCLMKPLKPCNFFRMIIRKTLLRVQVSFSVKNWSVNPNVIKQNMTAPVNVTFRAATKTMKTATSNVTIQHHTLQTECPKRTVSWKVENTIDCLLNYLWLF